jgi:hypothetical protein
MTHQPIYRFVGLVGIVFTFMAASSPAPLAQTNDEIRGKYNQAMMCGVHMGLLTVLAQRINDKKLEAAFEAATERYMRETVSLGAKLKKSKSTALDEFKKTGELYSKIEHYNEREIKTLVTSCAPEILPLLK